MTASQETMMPWTPRHPLPRPAADLELSAETMQQLTQQAMHTAIGYVTSLPDMPAMDLDGVRDVAATFREPVPESPVAVETLLPALDEAARKGFNAPGPGYLAFIPGGGLYPGAVGEYLALAFNRYVGVWNPSPPFVQIELTAIEWIRQLIGYPQGAAGLLTSGGSLANLIGVVTARRNRLPENFLDGMLYTSAEAHHCVTKAALLAGFPERNVRFIDTDERMRMRPDALRQAIIADRNAGHTPFLVIANAGTTNTGAVDPTPDIAAVCREFDMWLHVDAAYGGFFRMLDDGHALLPGLELADSIVLDPHKGLFLPYGTGCILVRDPETLRRAHQSHADYLQDLQLPEGEVNFSDISPELSREFRGLRVWLPFKLYGAGALRDNLREKLELARWAASEIREVPGFELVDEPQLSVVPFRYRPRRGDIDLFNQRLLERINARRRVFLTSTRVRGAFVLRIAVLSFRSHADTLRAAVEDIVTSAYELDAQG
jgi:aromatic-L-amino-acid decarboxylase